jgi:hypothetical protein
LDDNCFVHLVADDKPCEGFFSITLLVHALKPYIWWQKINVCINRREKTYTQSIPNCQDLVFLRWCLCLGR